MPSRQSVVPLVGPPATSSFWTPCISVGSTTIESSTKPFGIADLVARLRVASYLALDPISHSVAPGLTSCG